MPWLTLLEKETDKSIQEMIGSIQASLRLKCKRNVTLIDKTGSSFTRLNSALNFQMKEKAGQGLGIVVNKAVILLRRNKKTICGKTGS